MISNHLLTFALILPAILTSRPAEPRLSAPAVQSEPPSVMPLPRSILAGEGSLTLDSATSVAIVRFADERLRRATGRFIRRLEDRLGIALSRAVAHDSSRATIVIDVQHAGEKIQTPAEDESYSLVVTPTRAVLRANTVVGALRGMETVLQLADREEGRLTLPVVTIDDAPRFRWRGLLVDASRHFMPLSMIERTLDGMAAVKLNVLHWHLSDDQGFRVESKRYPKLHRLGSDSLFYTQKDIQTVVAYARDRGIRVVPEFDMPGHSTAWFVGYPNLASLPGPFEISRTFTAGAAAFDPTREEVYTFIDHFIAEMAPLFPDPYWHMGGDEVVDRHWNTKRIRAYRKRHRYRTNDDLQAYFTRRVARIVTRHRKRVIGWDEVLTGKIPPTTIIQAWRGESQLTKATAGGFATIYSAPYYLDHIKTAEEHYNADPIPAWTSLTPAQQERVLGGEACMWAEAVDSTTVDSRLWPRLGTIAERFWSPREVNDVGDMYRRLERLDQRLAEFGLDSRAHTERFVRRLVPNDSGARALLTVLEAVAPPTFGQRIRGQRTTQLTPLTGVLDAALPDPWGRWEVVRAVNELLADSLYGAPRGDGPMTRAQARARLEELFTRWRDAAVALRGFGAGTAGGTEAQPAADALARVSSIGLEALRYAGTADRAPPGWGEPLLAELTRLEEPQNLLRVVVVGGARRLVAAATGTRGEGDEGMRGKD